MLIRKKSFPAFGRIALFLALLNINLGNLLYFGDPTARITSCFLGVVLIVSILRENWRIKKRAFFQSYFLTALSFACLLLFLGSKGAGFIGLVCALGCLKAFGLKEGEQGQIHAFIATAGMVALFDYGYSHSTLVWYGVKKANYLLINLIGALTGQEMLFGHHASGFFILIPFIIYFFVLILLALRAGKKKFSDILAFSFVFLFLILASQALYLLAQQVIFSHIQLNVFQASFLLTPFGTHWLPFLLFLIPLSFINRRLIPLDFPLNRSEERKEKSTRSLKRSLNRLLPVSLLLFLLIASLFSGDRWSPLHFSPPHDKTILCPLSVNRYPLSVKVSTVNGQRSTVNDNPLSVKVSTVNGQRSTVNDKTIPNETILIYDNLDWSVPKFGYYGERSGGMFGNLPNFLSSLGYTVQVDKVITGEKLQKTDVLVIINLMEGFDEKTREAIHRYIKAGGSLLIMGDHTGYGFIREPFNDLLKPVPISFQFDSARSFIPSWQDCMEIRPHLITEHVATETDVQIWTGASLATRYPANPILIGKRAFSDAGNRANSQESFLGDFLYQRTEWLGDIVLAAEARFGQGKVLVFGDTSCLQNGALPYSRQFVQDIFQWLTEDSRSERNPYFQPLLWLLILFFLAVTWYEYPLIAVLCLVCSVYLLQGPAPFSPQPGLGCPHRKDETLVACKDKTLVAYIDNSHGELFDVTGWQKNSLDGLAYNLMRNHYTPFITKKLDSTLMDNSNMWVFINPTKGFSLEEKKALRNFMEKGGLLIWTASWTLQEASTSFWGNLGLSFADLPLGPVKAKCQNIKGKHGDYDVQFQDAWPIRIEERVKDRTSVFLQEGEYPLVVFQRYGLGGALLISDTRFFLNRNLEDVNNFFQEGNILFFRDVIKEISRG